MTAAHPGNFYRAFFEHSLEAALLADPDGRVFAANPAACELFARTEPEICQAGRAGLLDRTAAGLAGFLEERARTGKARAELVFIRGDGSRFIGEVSSSQFIDEQGQSRAVLSIRDLTRRRQQDSTLEESRALLDSIVNSTQDLIWSVDPVRFGILWYNRAFFDYFLHKRGIRIEVGLRPEDLFPDDAFIQLWRGFYQKAIENNSFSTEYGVYAKTNVLQLNLNVLKRGDEIFGVSVFGRDITDRKRAELLLAESSSKYQSLVSSMAEGVVFQAADGRIVAVNPAAERIQGRSAQEMMGHVSDDPMWQAIHEDGTPFPGPEHPAVVTLRTGEPQLNVVMGIKKPSGERRWLSINSAPVFGEDKARPSAVVATFHDITERRQDEQQIADYVRQLENTMRQTLQAVANMVEMRDPYTAGHSSRVGVIAGAIARELGWPEEKAQTLQLIGLVHDIGKIAVPVEILSKPSKLTPLEVRIVQTHAGKGFEILKEVSFPLPIATIIQQHHERMDGSGYPNGIRGEQILLEARILAVADVVESMASHRPYRPAQGIDAALLEIENNAGRLYDPQVVEALLNLVRNKHYTLPAMSADPHVPYQDRSCPR